MAARHRLRLRIRVRPTAFGLKATAFYSVVVTAFFASPYTNLFFLMVSFLTVLLMLNIWWTIQNVRGIRATLATPTAFAAGSVQECDCAIDTGDRPRLRAQLELRLTRGVHVLRHVVLIETKTKSLRCKLPKLQRGVHEIRSIHLTSTYPLGLMHAAIQIDGPDRLIVYPEPLSEHIVESNGGATGGAGDEDCPSIEPGGPGGETASLRDYRTGDSMRLVHWRASARRQSGLVVREVEPGSATAVEIQLDRRCTESEFERALSAVVRTALTAMELDQPIVLRSQGLDATFGIGHEAVQNLWAWLAIASPLSQRDPAEPPMVRSHDALRLPTALRRLARFDSGQPAATERSR